MLSGSEHAESLLKEFHGMDSGVLLGRLAGENGSF